VATVVNWLQDAVRRIRGFAYGGLAARPVRPRPRVGLALGGGFARGIAHIGVLRVLQQEGIPIDCVAGTSVGALIAASYACGAPLTAMEAHASDTRFRDFGRWTLSWLGLASNERLEDYLHRVCTAERFEELKTPLAIVATDLGSGEPVYFTRGEIAPPLRASCAYPGLFLPVEHEGRVLVDGFLAEPVPVEAVRKLGAEFVIAVYLEPGLNGHKPKSVAEVISRSFSIMQRYASANWRRRADVVIEPDVRPFPWDAFTRTPELIVAGEAAARRALPRLRAALQPDANRRFAVNS
jgi:NTE family protein